MHKSNIDVEIQKQKKTWVLKKYGLKIKYFLKRTLLLSFLKLKNVSTFSLFNVSHLSPAVIKITEK